MLQFLSLTYNLIFQLLLIFFMFWFSLNYSKKNKLSKLTVILLVILHFTFTFLTCYTSYNTTTDPPRYFNFAKDASSWFSLFGLSTTFIKFLIYPLINFLKLNYLSLFLIFSSFGIYGFLIFYKLINEFHYSSKINVLGVRLIFIILFLPSFHFWMSFLGKDSLTFMLSMMLLREFTYKSNKYFKMFILILILTFIRPYIGIFIVTALALVLFSEKINNLRRLLMLTLVIILGSIFSFKLLNNLNIDIEDFFDSRIAKVSRYIARDDVQGAFLDPSQMNLAEKYFAYLYRPLFYDASGTSQLLISLENLFLLILTIFFLIHFNLRVIIKNFELKVLILFCLIFLLVKGYLIYNLGIVNRQKFMIIPIGIYIMYFLINEKRKILYE